MCVCVTLCVPPACVSASDPVLSPFPDAFPPSLHSIIKEGKRRPIESQEREGKAKRRPFLGRAPSVTGGLPCQGKSSRTR